ASLRRDPCRPAAWALSPDHGSLPRGPFDGHFGPRRRENRTPRAHHEDRDARRRVLGADRERARRRRFMSEEKLNPLVELVLARLREFYREPAIVFWVFGFPLLMALGLGAAFRSKPPELPRIGVVMVEESAESLELLEKLKAHPAAITEVYDRE